MHRNAARNPFPLSRSPNKTVFFPKASTCIWAIVRILQHVYMLCHFMWFLLTVCDIKDMAQLRMPFRSWIFWHWELPQILVSIPTYPNHLLVPMSHGFPVFISWLWQAEWKLWQAMPQTWIWDQAANCVCSGMFVECTNVLYHISNCILRYLIYDIMIISIILQESFPCLPGVLGNLYCFTTLIDSANQTKSLPKILGGSGPRPRFRIEMMGCFMSWVARPWNPNVLWAAGGHLCWSDEPGGLEWNPRSWGLNWWEKV